MWPREGSPRAHAIAVVFGEPIRLPRESDRESEERFMQVLRARVIELLREGKAIYSHKNK